MKKISILILTYNAPEYVRETLETLQTTIRTEENDFEIIVVDNASQKETTDYLKKAKEDNLMDTLFFSNENLLFAKGNNTAARLASPETELFLLLNADVSIRNPHWLTELLNLKNKGKYTIAAFGMAESPPRADGYCYLIDRKAYEAAPLDENFPWYWGVTLQQANVLQNGGKILTVHNHEHMIVHYGGKSGPVSAELVNGAYKEDAQERIKLLFKEKTGIDVFDYQPLKTLARQIKLQIINAMVKLYHHSHLDKIYKK